MACTTSIHVRSGFPLLNVHINTSGNGMLRSIPGPNFIKGSYYISRFYSLGYAQQQNQVRPLPFQCSTKAHNNITHKSYKYEFIDSTAEVELRVPCPEGYFPSTKDVHVNLQETSLLVAVKMHGERNVLLSIDRLYSRIKPAETMWYIDEYEIVFSLKKARVNEDWPDIMEAWHSLTKGVSKMLKATSVYLVGDSLEINSAVARELAVGLKYTPLQTKDLLEQISNKGFQSFVNEEGEDSVAEAEAAVLGNINAHARLVVATLGGTLGAASRYEKWNKLHAGFTIWLSDSKVKDEASAFEEVRMAKKTKTKAYAMADVVVKLGGWHDGAAKDVAEGCLRALKQLIESEGGLPEKKSLYIRMGCRGDWPNIMPPGWEPMRKDAETVNTID